ncbi:MAG: sensor histidine kinase, partial [Thermomicrobiales bacterium]
MIQRLHSGAESALVAVAFSVIMPVAFAALPVTLGFAILRHRLYYVDLVINRTLLLVTMTALVIGTYVAVVVALGSLIGAQGSLPLSLLATELVAVGFQPVKQRVQGALNRLLFGDRDDPYKVLSRLGRQLESTFAPDEILPAIVRTLTEALRLPYAAVYLGGAQPSLAAASGVPTGEAVRLPLTYQQEPVGELVVSPRASGEHFGASDRRLLADLARQIGVAAHAVRLTDDLQRSRERIVTAREEERRRLRRDLHDGLGAQLAALSIQAGALRRVISTDPDAAVTQAAELGVELRAAVADIRRLVHGLRPPALDEVGLVAALRDRATRYGTGSIQQHADGARSSDRGLDVEFTARDDLSALPAAMEVAIYRIVDEALTNVMKHANATTCRVRLTHDAAIDLSIEDDGDGMSPTMRSGVGLMSMRERAEGRGGALFPASRSGGP